MFEETFIDDDDQEIKTISNQVLYKVIKDLLLP